MAVVSGDRQGLKKPQDAAVHADDKVITSFYAVDHRAARFTPDGELDAP